MLKVSLKHIVQVFIWIWGFGRHGFRGVLAGCHGISMSFVRWVIAQRYDEIGNRAISPQGMQRVVIKVIAGNGLGFCENSVF
jgi:hypothetical protein